MTTDYEEFYHTGKDALGPPDAAFVTFFERWASSGARVLDVGCGQGRDALFIARMGHEVVGVDLSAKGVSDLIEAARAETLDVTGIVADLVTWSPEGIYDVILFDRTLHMLATQDREDFVRRLVQHLAAGGHVLISDESRNLPGIEKALCDSGRIWNDTVRKRGRLFLQDVTGGEVK